MLVSYCPKCVCKLSLTLLIPHNYIFTQKEHNESKNAIGSPLIDTRILPPNTPLIDTRILPPNTPFWNAEQFFHGEQNGHYKVL